MNFTELAQANADHYNEHPTKHTTILVVYTVAAVIFIRKFIRRIARTEVNRYYNQNFR